MRSKVLKLAILGLSAGLWVGLPPGLAAAGASTPGYELVTGTVPGQVWRYTVLKPDLKAVALRAALRQGGGLLETLVPKDAVAAINGGYFDRAYRPTGWLVSDGKALNRANRTTPGGVLAVKGDRIYIGPTAKLPFETPDFAIQNSPVLLDEAGRVAIKKESGRRAARTVACLAQGALQLIVLQAPPTVGPTLTETAEVLARPVADGGFGCQRALNLDGGSSTGFWLASGTSTPSVLPIVPVGYGIALVPLAKPKSGK